MSERRPEDLLEHESLLEEDGPATPEELAEAARLRDALAAVDGGAADAAPASLGPLRAAVASGRAELPTDVHERLLAAALGPQPQHDRTEQPRLPAADEAATAADRRAAERLRDRLESRLGRDPDAEPDDPIEALVEVASAARSAFAPRPLDPLAAERALARASLGRATIQRGSRAARLRWGVALAAAAAAAVAVLPRTGLLPGADPATATMVPARSTQALFDPAEPFPREGGTSARIDRIAASRRADLRQNRFARWGIR